MKTIDELFEAIAASIPEEDICYSDLCFMITREISKQMDRKRISQTQLAKKIGKTPAFVSRALSGDQNLTLKTIACFITALDSQMEVRIFPKELKKKNIQENVWNSTVWHSCICREKKIQEDCYEAVLA